MQECVAFERRQLYLPVRRHMARMARAAETRENGQRRREVFLRFMITPKSPAYQSGTQRAYTSHAW